MSKGIKSQERDRTYSEGFHYCIPLLHICLETNIRALARAGQFSQRRGVQSKEGTVLHFRTDTIIRISTTSKTIEAFGRTWNIKNVTNPTTPMYTSRVTVAEVLLWI